MPMACVGGLGGEMLVFVGARLGVGVGDAGVVWVGEAYMMFQFRCAGKEE